MPLPDDADEWREQLASFCESYRRGEPRSEPESLDPMVDEQRRVTGGVLLQFLDFVQGDAAFENFPELEDNPIGDRVFVVATDRAGIAAAHDLIEVDSDHVMLVSKQEWRAFLESPATEPDETYDHHFLFWSVWHQDTAVDRQIEEALGEVAGEAWVHEEGFAVDDRAGRGARHLWSWNTDEGELSLVEEAISTWVSQPGSLGPPPQPSQNGV